MYAPRCANPAAAPSRRRRRRRRAAAAAVGRRRRRLVAGSGGEGGAEEVEEAAHVAVNFGRVALERPLARRRRREARDAEAQLHVQVERPQLAQPRRARRLDRAPPPPPPSARSTSSRSSATGARSRAAQKRRSCSGASAAGASDRAARSSIARGASYVGRRVVAAQQAAAQRSCSSTSADDGAGSAAASAAATSASTAPSRASIRCLSARRPASAAILVHCAICVGGGPEVAERGRRRRRAEAVDRERHRGPPATGARPACAARALVDASADRSCANAALVRGGSRRAAIGSHPRWRRIAPPRRGRVPRAGRRAPLGVWVGAEGAPPALAPSARVASPAATAPPASRPLALPVAGGAGVGGGDAVAATLISARRSRLLSADGKRWSRSTRRASEASVDSNDLRMRSAGVRRRVAGRPEPAATSRSASRAQRGRRRAGRPRRRRTLLARAVAGEAGVPFVSASGSEFVEMFVGVGASRVRDLFGEAKKNAPCIVFIDEIDAIGGARAGGAGGGMGGGGNDEREQTLNQILTEMDGFEGNSGVIVIAATNRADMLDPALLRPGRFDRRVPVDLPDKPGPRADPQGARARQAARRRRRRSAIVAKRTTGFSGASLANLMNEAAIVAARNDKIVRDSRYDEIDYAIDRRADRRHQKTTGTSFPNRQRLVAYHEAGHAVMGLLTPDYDMVTKVTIIPRTNGAGGFTLFTPTEERLESGLYSKRYLEGQLAVALGGRVAEEIVYGEDEVTTGASNDLQQVRNIARRIKELGGRRPTSSPSPPLEPPSGRERESVSRERVASRVKMPRNTTPSGSRATRQYERPCAVQRRRSSGRASPRGADPDLSCSTTAPPRRPGGVAWSPSPGARPRERRVEVGVWPLLCPLLAATPLLVIVAVWPPYNAPGAQQPGSRARERACTSAPPSARS